MNRFFVLVASAGMMISATVFAQTTTKSVAPSEASIAKGMQMYNSLGCLACHGANGNSSVPAYPSLAGLEAAHIVQQLKDFQTGKRKDPTMSAMAPLSVGHEQVIADYLSVQKPKK